MISGLSQETYVYVLPTTLTLTYVSSKLKISWEARAKSKLWVVLILPPADARYRAVNPTPTWSAFQATMQHLGRDYGKPQK